MRKLLMIIGGITIAGVLSWITVTFLGEPVWEKTDPDNENETISVEVPQLPIYAWYPWDARSGMTYFMTFIYQVRLEKML